MTKKGQNWTLKGSVTGKFLEHRLSNNRDAKIIITSKGSTTGLGKTTLAIPICRYVHSLPTCQADGEWSAEDNAFIDVKQYIQRYKNCPKGSALIIDELEYGADSRRSMSKDNVNLSHAWAQLRYRNVVSVATLPSVSMLDKRMMELADLWINVVERGKALPFYIWVNDFSGKVHRKVIKHPIHGGTEVLTWPDLDKDEDYEYLTSIKDKNVRTGETAQMYDSEHVNKKVKQAEKEKRNEIIKQIYHSDQTNISQAKLGKAVGLSQSMIDVIVNDK